ncbi:MAG: hypothetical protein CML29_06890 [Rhizobiales bacterium]|nr:hypothetical protein [Hyphomicrobiales bacterium]MBA69527.1 hypothetical protein [Hyphomicrobiales bacterium]
MEAAIRNALSRVENPDETQRARIYQTAREALIRNLESRGITEPEQVHAQVSRLKDLIARIEADYHGQAPMAAPAAPDVTASPLPSPGTYDAAPPVGAPTDHRQPAPEVRMDSGPAADRAEPVFGFSPADERAEQDGRFEPALGDDGDPVAPAPPLIETPPSRHAGDAPEITREARANEPPIADDGLTLPPPHRDVPQGTEARRSRIFSKTNAKPKAEKTPRRRERHVFASGFSSLVLLAFLGIGVWWLYDTGAFDADWDTSVPNPPPSVSSDDFTGDGSGPRRLNPESGFSGSWTTIYAPRQSDAISPGSLASAEVVSADNGSALKIVSTSGGEDGEVALPIETSALRELAGRASVIAITVRAAGDEPTAFYVTCDFGTMGDCGRRRFNAETQASDALIEVDFTRALAPSSGGTISINSDVEGRGRAIDLFGIRIRPAN